MCASAILIKCLFASASRRSTETMGHASFLEHVLQSLRQRTMSMSPRDRTTCALITLYVFAAHANNFPQWRGPDGQGHAVASGLPQSWSETENVAWKTSIPGRGFSSPVIEGKQIWITTAFETPAKPEAAQQRLKANTGNQPVTVLEEVRFHAICLDRDSGRIVHDLPVLTEREPQWVHEQNSYASPTPVIEEGRLYGHFGASGTVCVDARAGRVLWTNASLRVNHENGPGSSLMLWKDLVIFHLDGSDEQYIAALDKRTGKLAWKTARTGKMSANGQMRKSYGTPLAVDIAGRTQLVSPAADWLYFYDPANGRELTKLSYGAQGFSIAPRPVAGHGMIFMSTAFLKPEMLAIRYDSAAGPTIEWRSKRGAPNVPSPLLVGDELYFVSDSGGIVTCLDAKTGQENYSERLGGNFYASPLYADGKLIFVGREGALVHDNSVPNLRSAPFDRVSPRAAASGGD